MNTTLSLEAHGASYRMHDHPGRIARCVAAGRPYEASLLEHIYEQAFEGLAIDAGANIGNHTLWFAAVCALEVVAFEPLTVEELRSNVDLNDLQDMVRVEPVALGSEAGTAAAISRGRLETGQGDISVRCLDDFDLRDVALIKIDVEDMEPHVLRGGEETIRRDRPVIFAEARDEACHAAIAEILEPWGYSMTRRFDSKSVATPVERWDG